MASGATELQDEREPDPFSASGAPPEDEHAFFGHPRGLATLFMTELWERFSYYGMRSLLVLFLTVPTAEGGIGLDSVTAASVFSVYSSMICMLAILGGWLSDRVWGARRAVLVGALVIMGGHFTLAVPLGATFWPGLGLIAVGTGLLKPNVSAIVGQLYRADDPRRDGGFTVFYLAINSGAFLAPLAIGTVGQRVGWHLGFSLAGVGMGLGVLQYVLGRRHLGRAGELPGRPAGPEVRRRMLRSAALWAVAATLLLTADVLLGRFSVHEMVDVLGLAGTALPFWYFTRLRRDRELSVPERTRMSGFLWFFVASAVFWMIYDQSGSTLNLFAKESTELSLLGVRFPSSWFNSVNPLFIILLAPLFAWLWQWLQRRGRNPSTPVKFGVALLLIGASFGVMGLAELAASGGTRVSPLWLVGVYFVQTVAELFLSPVGLSLTTKLAPAKYTSQMLGLWFLSMATGDAVAGWTTQLRNVISPMAYFYLQGALAVACGAAFLLAAGRIRRLMGTVR
ncbi:peptide MFS transporter [Kitasatospora sp. GP82]|uniref:peptide MFS transporter n=1 Tax=Kitasatospora sp. GP82 TaxID=3035089 RepID=UPI00247435F5|nr:peptide MFS transporter [Kitasatospora sp. GP82]MDH6124110.1 POT family proton-dependent oligopeptide transporter [Kitasatospora sp. GP82]